MTLCTQLPDLPPADGAERVFFVNALRHDWCHDDDVDDLHQAFRPMPSPTPSSAALAPQSLSGQTNATRVKPCSPPQHATLPFARDD